MCDSCGAILAGVRTADAAAPFAGEIKHATVLFADVVGSTELVARLDPEQAMHRLQPVLAAMRENVERYDGTVAQTLGDGIMALFGAPRAQEGHALLACEAALAMHRAFPGDNGSEGGLRIRVGLHTGSVVAGGLLPGAQGNGTVHGVTVHVASRLQAMAAPSATFLTEDCYRLVRSYCLVRPLGRQAIRGLAGGMEVYQLMGLRPAVASRRFRGSALAAFQGRSRELDALHRALQAAGDGQAAVIGIAGAPGTGKSRLCYEFAKRCRSRLIPVFEARAHPYGRAAPLQPVLEFFRASLFRLSPSDSPAVARQRITARLAGLGPEFNADLPLLFDFLGVPDEDAPAPVRLTPARRRERLLDMVRQLARWHGRRQWVLVIEDLHWLDEASEAFVGAMVDAIQGTRTLLVLNYRPAYAAPWMQRPWFQGLTLAELSAPATADLVEGLIGRHPALLGLRRRIVERSGGNPFFAEELVRSLVDEGALAGAQGRRVPGRPAADTLPKTVQAVIGARIDRLGASERMILQICSIIGREFPHTVLAQVSGTARRDLEAGLSGLMEAEMLQPLPTDNGPRSGFRHPMIQEVAYGSQLKVRRDALHATVASAMGQYYAGRLDEFSALLAHHHEQAGHTSEAVHYAARAARWVGSNSPAQAIRHWRKVRELMRGGLASRGEDALRIMASAQIAWLGWREGLHALEAKPLIEEAIGWAREADDTMVPLLLFVEARIAGASGGAADAYVAQVKDALAMLRPGPDDGRAATLYTALSQAYGWAGLQDQALAASDAALARVAATARFDHEFLGYSVERWAKSLRGRILTRLGRFQEAAACFDSMAGPEFEVEDPAVRFIPHLAGADVAWVERDAEAADHHAARIGELATASGSLYLQVSAHKVRGAAKSIKGDHAGAVEDYEAALGIVRDTQAANDAEAELMACLAEARFALGDHAAAASVAQEGLVIARRRTTRLPECRLCIILALAYGASLDPAREGDIAALLDHAAFLLDLTGAQLYAPVLARARTALRRPAAGSGGAPEA